MMIIDDDDDEVMMFPASWAFLLLYQAFCIVLKGAGLCRELTSVMDPQEKHL